MTGEVLNPVQSVETGTTTLLADTPEVFNEDAALEATFDRLVTNNGSDRGEGGKFKSPNPETEGGQGGDSPSKDGDGAAGADNPPVVGTAAPAHLPQAIKAEWDKMPETARTAIAAHQAEMDRKFGEQGKLLGQVKPLADKLTEAVTKFPDFKGMTPDQIAQGAIELGAVQVALGKNPVGTIIEIAQHYKCLPQLVQAIGGKGEAGDPNNTITSLQQEVSGLKAQLQKVSNPDTLRETVSTTLAEQMKQKEAETAFLDWSKDQEFYAEVEADLAYFVGKVIESKGRERPAKEILTEAYDMAINANPDVRAKVRVAEAKATAANADPKRTEAAKKAASINVPSNGSGKERQMTEDELLAASYDRKMAS